MRSDHAEELQRQINKLFALMEDLKTVEGGTAWIDYSATSTIVGWSSFTTKKIQYKKVGKLVFVSFDLNGTSDPTTGTSVSFTLPFNVGFSHNISIPIVVDDNSVTQTSSGRIDLVNTSATVNCYKTLAAGAWTASGSKRVRGEFWYIEA